MEYTVQFNSLRKISVCVLACLFTTLALQACKGKVTVNTPLGEGQGEWEGEGGEKQIIPPDFTPDGDPCGQCEIGGKIYYIYCSGGRPIYMKPKQYEPGESPYLIPIDKPKPVQQPWKTSAMAGKAGKVQFRQLSENEFEFEGQSYEFFPNTPLIPSEMWNGSAEELIADWNLEDLGNGDAVVLPVEFEVDHATGEVTAVMAFTTGIGITALPSPWQFDLDQETVVVVSQDPHGTDLVLKAVRGSKQDVVRYFGKLGKTAEIEGVPVNLN